MNIRSLISFSNFKVSFFLFSVIFVITSANFSPAHSHELISSDEVMLKVLHTNDTHAHLNSHIVGFGKTTEEVGGISALAWFIKKQRASEKNTLLLSAGDVFQGTMFFNFFKGLADYECMNLAGYDAMCPGNHEFDESASWFLEAVQKTNFDVINCNVIFGSSYKKLPNKIKPYVIKEAGNLKIAIIGVLTKELFNLASPKKLADIQIVDPIEALGPIVKKLRPDVDMILILSHMGLKEDLELAEMVPDIDLIIGGHSHSLLVSPIVLRTSKGKQVVINQAYEKGEYVGEVNMAFSHGQKSWRLIDGRLNRLDKNSPRDENIQKIVDNYRTKINREVLVEIGETLTPLIGDKDSVRSNETNLGNLIADCMKSYSGADLAVINGGGIRTGIQKGKITIESCINVFPFDNTITKLMIKGSALKSLFSMVAQARRKGSCGCYLQVSKGVFVKYKEGAVAELKLNGAPIEDNRLYSVAMSDFTAGGGDGFTMLPTIPDRFTDGAKINDVLVEYVKSQKVLNLNVEGRIEQ